MKYIAFLGDSLTDANRIRTQVDDLGNGYLYLLQQHLAASQAQLTLLNLGFNGYRMIDLIFELSNDETLIRLKKADSVFLFIGINDVWHTEAFSDAEWQDYFKRCQEQWPILVKMIQQEVLSKSLQIIIPTAAFKTAVLAERLKIFQDWFKKSCEIKQLPYIETADFLTEPTDFVADGVHFTTQGQAKLATALYTYFNV